MLWFPGCPVRPCRCHCVPGKGNLSPPTVPKRSALYNRIEGRKRKGRGDASPQSTDASMRVSALAVWAPTLPTLFVISRQERRLALPCQRPNTYMIRPWDHHERYCKRAEANTSHDAIKVGSLGPWSCLERMPSALPQQSRANSFCFAAASSIGKGHVYGDTSTGFSEVPPRWIKDFHVSQM